MKRIVMGLVRVLQKLRLLPKRRRKYVEGRSDNIYPLY